MGHTGVHCGVDGGVAPAGADNGVNGKADGIVRQRRTSIGRSSVGRGSVVGGGIGSNSDSSGRNGGDQGMSGGGEGLGHNGRDQRRRERDDGGIGSMPEHGGGYLSDGGIGSVAAVFEVVSVRGPQARREDGLVKFHKPVLQGLLEQSASNHQ